jgi:glycine amidinotransferase
MTTNTEIPRAVADHEFHRSSGVLKQWSPVSSYNEWDPLEEVIVGVLDHATIPSFHPALEATMPDRHVELFKTRGGKPFPSELIAAGQRELDALCRVLEAEGVIVRRPEPVDCSRGFATPDWAECGGLYSAMPRDVALVVGSEIIEAPMAWRSRYFEIHAYRSLFRHYFESGGRWAAAPRPVLSDASYNPEYEGAEGDDRFVGTNVEPTFDAADFVRCGRDIFAQRSHVTNHLGIEWLRRHLRGEYRVHELSFNDPSPMHIDATFVPLAPGKLLINPERVAKIPDVFRGWEVLVAPRPCIPEEHPMFMSSRWVSMNILMLDHERVLVERGEKPLIELLRSRRFTPIPCDFRHFNSFGGSFHCATLDVRRRGELRSYF